MVSGIEDTTFKPQLDNLKKQQQESADETYRKRRI